MSDKNVLKYQIEQLRERLHELVIEKQGNFADDQVARMSTELDELIVQYEKAK